MALAVIISSLAATGPFRDARPLIGRQPSPAKVGACSNIASDRRPPSRFPVPWRGKLPAQIQPRFYDLRECFLDNYGLFDPIKLPILFLATILTLVGERGGRMPCQGRIWRYLHPALQLKGAGPTEH